MRKIAVTKALTRLAQRLKNKKDTRNSNFIGRLAMKLMRHKGSVIVDEDIQNSYEECKKDILTPEIYWVPMKQGTQIPLKGLKPRYNGNFRKKNDPGSFISVDEIRKEIVVQQQHKKKFACEICN